VEIVHQDFVANGDNFKDEDTGVVYDMDVLKMFRYLMIDLCTTYFTSISLPVLLGTFPGAIMVVGVAQMTDSFTLSTTAHVTTPRYFPLTEMRPSA